MQIEKNNDFQNAGNKNMIFKNTIKCLINLLFGLNIVIF
jgi:hypothetical protein